MRQPPAKAWTRQPYPAYKDSGMEWLGKVPQHWTVQRMATVAEIRVSNVDKHSKEGEHPVRLCNYVDVYHNERISADVPFMGGTAKREEIQKFRLAVGDVLVTKDSENWKDIGVPALVEYAADDLVCGYHLAMLRPKRESLDGGYLSYALRNQHVAWQCQVAAVGVTRYGLSQNAIKSVKIPLPPLPEQHAIAHFLDYTTQHIQHHIQAKEKLIKLLEEKKQVIIHQAVTGQINVQIGQPYPAYRDSGVEWLRRVPEHWEMLRSKRLFRPRIELARPDDIQLSATQAYGVIAQADYEKKIGRKVTRILRHLEKRRHVEIDDFVISMRSFQGGIERAWSSGCIRSSYVVLQSTKVLIVGYFGYLFKSASYISALQSTANFIRDGQDLNFDNFCQVDLPFPPMKEQHAIAHFLTHTNHRISQHRAAVKREIDLLHEYRTRLIADVVTGKLDVREAAAHLPKSDPPPLAANCQDGTDLADPGRSPHP